ncbi:hypothetical protein AHMF7605_16880 [Adhaeribacter arboris]|uniref:Uncharacterized protein n=1 Tax=Adhaeribacter arboris TaxID=2072846 RepID=A0A2T2YHW2_9BACT|nr:hypothetical protein [Adhaeribacter arboris]PSR55058.1 hypothetical protein AHMF7605_16880 [Adhaeribacter arboris]
MSFHTLVNPVLDKVHQLTYSEDSIYDFFSLANKAYLLIYTQGADGKKEYLDRLKRVIETQIRPLLEEELTREEKKNLFNTAKTSFEAQLEAYLKQIQP